ncbi:MAG TPA: hypothetical protein VFW87_17540 [Pirellulales bacterium]|nr:hypothetical protein [Pirellulales bacterium]
MATIPSQEYRDTHYTGRALSFAIGESTAEAVCGLAAIVVAIVGLANPEWTILTPIATILASAALVFAGATACSRCMASSAPLPSTTEREMEAGMSAEILGGIAGVVLGILAILGLAANLLVSIAIIVFGASLLLGSMATVSFRSMATAEGGAGTHYGVSMARGSHVLFGLATIILGIVALVGEAQYGPILNLVGLLVVGAGVLMTATAFARRLMGGLVR